MRFVYELIVKRAPKEAWIAMERINGARPSRQSLPSPAYRPISPSSCATPFLPKVTCSRPSAWRMTTHGTLMAR